MVDGVGGGGGNSKRGSQWMVGSLRNLSKNILK